MPTDLHRELLRFAAGGFAAGSLLAQVVAFRSATRGPVKGALLRGALAGLVPLLAVFVLWATRAWSRAGWESLIGLEILVAFGLLQGGLAAVAIRGAVEVLSRDGAGKANVPQALVRGVVLALGWLYAAAVALRAPGGPGETLFSVAALGGACLLLGLHRLPPEASALLAGRFLDRRPRP